MSKSKLYNFTPDELQKLLDTNATYISILRIAGINSSSSTVTLKRIIKEYNLDTSKFEDNRKNYNINHMRNLNNSQLYDIESKLKNGVSTSSHTLKNKLIELGYKEAKCEMCGITEWMGKPVKFHLHHIDGNHTNNELLNLQILCPNCHSMTDNFGVYNSERYKNDKLSCKKCGKSVSKYNKSGLCFSCFIEARKTNPESKPKHKTLCPYCNTNLMYVFSNMCSSCHNKSLEKDLSTIISRDQLKELIRNNPFTKIGNMFNVSDNAIRKWCDKYNLPKKSTDIRKYSDEEWKLI